MNCLVLSVDLYLHIQLWQNASFSEETIVNGHRFNKPIPSSPPIQLTPVIFCISGHILETETFLYLQQTALLNTCTCETVLQKMVLNYLYFTSCG